MLWNTLLGLAAIVAISGLGRLVLRLCTRIVFPLHWYLSLAMLSGTAVVVVLSELAAIVGASRPALMGIGGILLSVGSWGHMAGPAPWSSLPPFPRRSNIVIAAFLGGGILMSLFAALAPSTKADELRYHMLFSHRIVEDGGLRLYQFPAEQAITPQMGYQAAQSILHAAGAPDSGNLLSFAFGAVLVLLIFGLVLDESGEPGLALFAAAACAVGIYPSVWHVTAGPHALGDLATATAVGIVFFSGGLRQSTSPNQRAILCAFASSVAALTKISLFPLGIFVNLIALRAAPARSTRLVSVAIVIWLGIHTPLVLWSVVNTGSPFGLATAAFFHSTAYEPAVFAKLEEMWISNQSGLWIALKYICIELNGATILLFVIGVAASVTKRSGRLGLVVILLVQIILISILLPHHFRFLGGLQYPLVAAGAIALAPGVRTLSRKRQIVAAIVLLGPWLVLQAYYIRPFVSVVAGLEDRLSFQKRYIPFIEDFQNLDRILPPNASIFVPRLKAPSVHFPRTVIYSLKDWNRNTPLFVFDIVTPSEDVADRDLGLRCFDESYRNNDAVITTYRTPGEDPYRGQLLVRRCEPLTAHH